MFSGGGEPFARYAIIQLAENYLFPANYPRIIVTFLNFFLRAILYYNTD